MTTLHFDGGSRGNPGLSGCGFIIKTNSGYLQKIITGNLKMKKATNNEAEYTALIEGLKTAIKHDIREITVYGDSKLVIMQSKGLWKVSAKNLMELNTTIKELSKSFENIDFIHIPREQNKDADKLANQSMDYLTDYNKLECSLLEFSSKDGND